jgi:hypothetical protein
VTIKYLHLKGTIGMKNARVIVQLLLEHQLVPLVSLAQFSPHSTILIWETFHARTMILQEMRVAIILHYIMIGIHLTTEKGFPTF